MEGDEEISVKVETKQQTTCYKVMRTFWLIITWISMGSFMEVAGATLKDLIYRLNTDYGSISSSYAGRSVGKFIGTLLGGILVDRFGRYADLMIAVSLTLAAVGTLSLPWVKHLEVLWFLYFVLGTCLGVINIPGQRILLSTWLEKSASPMHIIHLGYGVGGFLVPLIVNPFLADFSSMVSENLNITTEQDTETNNSKLNFINSSTFLPASLPVSRIEYGYAIIAVYTAVTAFVFFIYQYFVSKTSTGKREQNNSGKNKLMRKRGFKEMINPASCADNNLCYGILVLGLLFLRYFWIVAAERTSGTFLRSYVVDQLDFSTDNASYLNTIYWISHAVGRFITFVIARWVSIRIIMVAESICFLLTGIGLLILALENQTAMWVLAVCMGLFLGPMFPTGIAWGDFHIEMTGMAITFVILGSAFGGYTFIKIAGASFDAYGPPAFVYLYLGVGVFILVTDLALTFVSLIKSRITKKPNALGKTGENEIISLNSM